MSQLGDVWPRCANCRHVAQAHDNNGCDEITRGQCPTCGTWQEKIPCQCKTYVGPTQEEFITNFLTPEEQVMFREFVRLHP